MEKHQEAMQPLPPPYTDETPEDVEKGTRSGLGAVESFVMDCSDGDEEPLINSSIGGRVSVPCRWQKAVKVKDYGMWNMCACFCCCWIVSIAGLYKSLKCQSAKRQGAFTVAGKYSKQARILFWVSFFIGMIVWIVIAAIYGIMIVAYIKLFTSMQNPDNAAPMDYDATYATPN